MDVKGSNAQNIMAMQAQALTNTNAHPLSVIVELLGVFILVKQPQTYKPCLLFATTAALLV